MAPPRGINHGNRRLEEIPVRLVRSGGHVLMWPHTSSAYTSEQQQACTPDAMRLCSAYIPDVDSITACMNRNKSQLSPTCRAFFRPGPETGEAVDASAH